VNTSRIDLQIVDACVSRIHKLASPCFAADESDVEIIHIFS